VSKALFRFLYHSLLLKGSYSPNVLGRRDTVTAVLSPGRVARISQGNLDKNVTKYKKKNTNTVLLAALTVIKAAK
jgi:hypothetical protein